MSTTMDRASHVADLAGAVDAPDRQTTGPRGHCTAGVVAAMRAVRTPVE
jgi:hypothetical protein